MTTITDVATKIRVIDFETTGFPPEAGIVEIGWCDVEYDPSNKTATVGNWESELVNSGRKIEIAAMAVHHIQDADIQDKRAPGIVLAELVKDVDYFCAHNAKFEKEFFQPQQPWICTLKAAYRLCPSAPNHQNQTLRYFLKTPVNAADAVHTHRAGPDAYVTAHTLAKFLSAVTIDQLVKWDSEPPLFPFCPIGKARGQKWPDVERGFLAWICRTATMDEDIKWNARRELDRRDGKL